MVMLSLSTAGGRIPCWFLAAIAPSQQGGRGYKRYLLVTADRSPHHAHLPVTLSSNIDIDLINAQFHPTHQWWLALHHHQTSVRHVTSLPSASCPSASFSMSVNRTCDGIPLPLVARQGRLVCIWRMRPSKLHYRQHGRQIRLPMISCWISGLMPCSAVTRKACQRIKPAANHHWCRFKIEFDRFDPGGLNSPSLSHQSLFCSVTLIKPAATARVGVGATGDGCDN